MPNVLNLSLDTLRELTIMSSWPVSTLFCTDTTPLAMAVRYNWNHGSSLTRLSSARPEISTNGGVYPTISYAALKYSRSPESAHVLCVPPVNEK